MDFFGLSLYLVIALVCFLFLFMSVFLGDFMDFDVDVDMDIDADYGSFGGPGVSPLSLPIILSFGVGFGAFGALFESYEIMDSRFIPLPAGVMGSLFAGGIFLFFSKFLIGSQGTTKVTKADLVGETAKVTIPIDPGELGQVLVITQARGRTLLDARSDEELPRNASVKIISFEGTTVRVQKIGD